MDHHLLKKCVLRVDNTVRLLGQIEDMSITRIAYSRIAA